MDLWEDDEEELALLQSSTKKGRGNRKRKAGSRPITARQQMDQNVREKLKGCKSHITMAQRMSTAFVHSDDCNPDATHDDQTLSQMNTQRAFSRVLHGMMCHCKQANNKDHASPELFLLRPEICFCVGGESAKRHLEQALAKKRCTVSVHSDFDECTDSFRSEAAKKKARKNK